MPAQRTPLGVGKHPERWHTPCRGNRPARQELAKAAPLMERLLTRPPMRLVRSAYSLPFVICLAAGCGRGSDSSNDDGGAQAPSRVEAQPGTPTLPPGLARTPGAAPSANAAP